MSSRTRVADGRFQVCGSYYAFGTLQDYSCMTHGPYWWCEDTVGDWETSNVFDLNRQFSFYPTVDKPGEFIGYPIQYHPGPVDPRTAWPAYGLADKNMLAWEILSKTNPSLPVVNVPAYLGELKDIPGLMRNWGRSLLRDVARGHLLYRWAYKPLVSDLRKLYRFQRHVNNRMQELLSLRDGRTMKRRCHLGRASVIQQTHNVPLHSIRFLLRATKYVTLKSEVWGTAEWKLLPDSKLPQLGYAPLEGLAHSSATGINSYGALAAAWELTPWSWFADWFSNIGTCLNASNNSLGMTFGRISLMRHSSSKTIYTKTSLGIPPSGYTLNGWPEEEWERKERHPVFPVIPVPLPTLPFLTKGQLSILGALAVLKALKP